MCGVCVLVGIGSFQFVEYTGRRHQLLWFSDHDVVGISVILEHFVRVFQRPFFILDRHTHTQTLTKSSWTLHTVRLGLEMMNKSTQHYCGLVIHTSAYKRIHHLPLTSTHIPTHTSTPTHTHTHTHSHTHTHTHTYTHTPHPHPPCSLCPTLGWWCESRGL